MEGLTPIPGGREAAPSGLSISTLLEALADQRPVFHSEADFQHALAWEVHRRLPSASIRLERPVRLPTGVKPLHVDVWAEQDGKILAKELKYKTRPLQTSERGEGFVLQDHSAEDTGRCDFIKDVWRVETIVKNYANKSAQRQGPGAEGRNRSGLPAHTLCSGRTTPEQRPRPSSRRSVTSL